MFRYFAPRNSVCSQVPAVGPAAAFLGRILRSRVLKKPNLLPSGHILPGRDCEEKKMFRKLGGVPVKSRFSSIIKIAAFWAADLDIFRSNGRK